MTDEYKSLDDFQAWELDAYADGEALPHVEAFFTQNPTARAAWLRQRKFDAQLSKVLHRFDCPSPELLRDYYWGELSAAAEQKFQAHLSICPRCTAELTSFQAFMQEVQTFSPTSLTANGNPQGSWGQNFLSRLEELTAQMRLVIANLVTPTMSPGPAMALRDDPLPAAQESEKTLLLFEADDTDISLVIQKERNGTVQLDGQVFMTEIASGDTCKLIPANQAQASVQTPLDEMGNFAIIRLPPGAYQLVLLLERKMIVMPNLLLQ